jgi:hypothetical protein
MDINTSGDYIKLLHINKMNKLLLIRTNEIIGDKSENPLIRIMKKRRKMREITLRGIVAAG